MEAGGLAVVAFELTRHPEGGLFVY
jgi:hypothetical protein